MQYQEPRFAAQTEVGNAFLAMREKARRDGIDLVQWNARHAKRGGTGPSDWETGQPAVSKQDQDGGLGSDTTASATSTTAAGSLGATS